MFRTVVRDTIIPDPEHQRMEGWTLKELNPVEGDCEALVPSYADIGPLDM